MKYKAIIVDDELNAQNILEELLQKYPEIEVAGKFFNAEDALQSITKFKPDLIFSDIDMPGKSGLDLAYEIRDKNINTNIIFITAFNEYAVEAFKVAAFDYLLKPIDTNKIDEVLHRFIENRSNYNLNKKVDKLFAYINPEKIRFNNQNGFVLINPDKIVYLLADGNYTNIIINPGIEEYVSQQIGIIEKKLDSSIFIRINRSTIINIHYLLSFNRRTKKVQLSYSDEVKEFKVNSKSQQILRNM